MGRAASSAPSSLCWRQPYSGSAPYSPISPRMLCRAMRPGVRVSGPLLVDEELSVCWSGEVQVPELVPPEVTIRPHSRMRRTGPLCVRAGRHSM